MKKEEQGRESEEQSERERERCVGGLMHQAVFRFCSHESGSGLSARSSSLWQMSLFVNGAYDESPAFKSCSSPANRPAEGPTTFFNFCNFGGKARSEYHILFYSLFLFPILSLSLSPSLPLSLFVLHSIFLSISHFLSLSLFLYLCILLSLKHLSLSHTRTHTNTHTHFCIENMEK